MEKTEHEQEIDDYVGKKIRSLRYAHSDSQDDLGNAIGVRFQQIQKYERGKNRVSASKLKLIAEHYFVSVDYFFESQDDSNNLFEDKEICEMAYNFSQLSEEFREKILDLVKALSK